MRREQRSAVWFLIKLESHRRNKRIDRDEKKLTAPYYQVLAHLMTIEGQVDDPKITEFRVCRLRQF